MVDTLTALDRWLASGHVTPAQYAALVQWREDGGGIRRRRQNASQSPQEPRERDFMVEAARSRHRTVFRAVEALSADAARSVHRLVMCDDERQRVDRVQRGAEVVWVWYRG